MKNILLLCTRSVTVANFRKGLINYLIKHDYKVSVCAFDDERKEEIEELGVDFYVLNSNNRNINPFSKLLLVNKYVKVIKKVNPKIVFTFQAMPNIFGVISSKIAGVKKIYSMVEGLGDPFILAGIKWKIIKRIECILYRLAFKSCSNVFFLNHDDINDFIKLKIVDNTKAIFIHGVGVNTKHFDYSDVNKVDNFIMISRLMPSKGIIEYLEASRRIKKEYPNSIMYLVGEEFTLKKTDIQEYIDDNSIEYLGYQKDVRPFISRAGICVLPSYREGCPMTIMEAESMGRGVIVSDVPGCKETIIDGFNGLFVKPKDAEDLYNKMKYIVDNPKKVKEFSLNARTFALNNFDEELINSKIIDCIEK